MNDNQRDLMDQLRRLGFEPTLLNNRVVFEFGVETGACQGQTVRVGLDTDNWPNAPSHWIHAEKPCTDGGNVRQSEIGPEWRKFSRNFSDWRQLGADAKAVIAHLHRVFKDVTKDDEGGTRAA